MIVLLKKCLTDQGELSPLNGWWMDDVGGTSTLPTYLYEDWSWGHCLVKMNSSKRVDDAGRQDPEMLSRLRRFIKLRRSAVTIQSLYRRNVAARKVGLIRHRNHLDFVYRTAARMQALVRAFQQKKKSVLHHLWCIVIYIHTCSFLDIAECTTTNTMHP